MDTEHSKVIFRVSLFGRIGLLLFITVISMFEELQMVLTAKALICIVSAFVVFQCWKHSRPLWVTLFGFVAIMYLPFFTWRVAPTQYGSQVPQYVDFAALVLVLASFIFIRQRKPNKEKRPLSETESTSKT